MCYKSTSYNARYEKFVKATDYIINRGVSVQFMLYSTKCKFKPKFSKSKYFW